MIAERFLVIGSGSRFLSGISHYTHALALALSINNRTSVLLMRSLVPRRLYPGAKRVGTPIANLAYPDNVRVFDGVDWYWLPSLLRGLRFMWRERPTVVVVQWWTGAVAHSYLVLIAAARLRGARVVFEMHEVQDTGEARIPLATTYTRLLLRLITPMVDGFVTHSKADRLVLTSTFRTAGKPVEVIRHAPFGQYSAPQSTAMREAPVGTINLTYFGTIRPYKGLEDLVRAFDELPDPSPFWLTVVGETWEGWTLPGELIAASPNGDRITFVNHYVTEEEATRWLAGADALVLPYRRSSASGPLHVGMALGLPIITTEVPALVEAAEGYEGCIFVPPRDVGRIRDALESLPAYCGKRYQDPGSWAETVRRYERLITKLAPRCAEGPTQVDGFG